MRLCAAQDATTNDHPTLRQVLKKRPAAQSIDQADQPYPNPPIPPPPPPPRTAPASQARAHPPQRQDTARGTRGFTLATDHSLPPPPPPRRSLTRPGKHEEGRIKRETERGVESVVRAVERDGGRRGEMPGLFVDHFGGLEVGARLGLASALSLLLVQVSLCVCICVCVCVCVCDIMCIE